MSNGFDILNFAKLFDNLPQGYLIIETESGILRGINIAAGRLLSIDPQIVLGKTFPDELNHDLGILVKSGISIYFQSKKPDESGEAIVELLAQAADDESFLHVLFQPIVLDQKEYLLLQISRTLKNEKKSNAIKGWREDIADGGKIFRFIPGDIPFIPGALQEAKNPSTSFAITDLNGKVIYFSNSLPEHFAPFDEIAVGKIFPFFTERINLHFFSDTGKLNKQYFSWGIKYQQKVADGLIKTKYLHLYPLKNKSGKVNRLLILVEDVRETTVDLPTYSEMATMLGLALKVAKIGFWRLNEHTRQVTWSEGIEHLFSLQSSNAAELRNLHHYIHPEDWLLLRQHIQQCFDTLQPFECWFRVSFPGHETMWFYTYGVPLCDKDSGMKEIFAIIRDITERIIYDQKLQNEIQFRQLLVEMATKYINLPLDQVDEQTNWWLRKMGEFVGADRSYIFDYDYDKQICINTYEWCYPGIEPQIDNLQAVPLELIPEWVSTHQKGQSVIIDNVQALPDTPLKKILDDQSIKSVISVPMMEDNHCVGFVGFDFVRDYFHVTETEQQLLKLYAQIFVNLSLRIRYENEIRKAREAAESGDRLKTAFINNISHEIRTPLSSILGFGEYLMSSDFTPEEKENYLFLLRSSTQRLIDTVNNYLDMARLVSGNMDVTINPFTIPEMLSETINEVRMLCAKKNINISLSIDENIYNIPINSDKILIQKVLKHLLDNALKFTPQGEISVSCHLEGEYVRFSVRDTGIGIPGEKIRSIFDMFTQGEISITRGYEGSGLGLTISRGIIQLLGGTIGVKSSPGSGSDFYFTIPFVYQKDFAPITKKSLPRRVVKPQDEPLIIVADDNEDNYRFISLVLHREGFKTIHARDGQEAVEMSQKYSNTVLILMDLKMPRMSGAEAAKKIRQIYPLLPIIFITGFVNTFEDYQVRQAGFHDILPKPFNKQQLLAALRKYIEW